MALTKNTFFLVNKLAIKHKKYVLVVKIVFFFKYPFSNVLHQQLFFGPCFIFLSTFLVNGHSYCTTKHCNVVSPPPYYRFFALYSKPMPENSWPEILANAWEGLKALKIVVTHQMIFSETWNMSVYFKHNWSI